MLSKNKQKFKIQHSNKHVKILNFVATMFYTLLYSKVAISYYVFVKKLLEHDTFKLKQLKRWLRENTILATRVWLNGDYASRSRHSAQIVVFTKGINTHFYKIEHMMYLFR